MYRDLLLIGASLFLWGVGETAFFSFQPLYLEQLGATPLQIGAIIGGYGFAGILVHMPAGYLADHIGRRPVMLAGWLLGLLSTVIMLAAKTLPLYIAGMFLYASTTFVVAPMNSYVTSARGNFSVQRILTLVSIGYNLGAIIGPIVGGTIGEHFGFRIIYLFAVCIFIISNLIIYFIHSQPVEIENRSENGKSLLSNSNFILFTFFLFFSFFAMYLPQPLTPNYLQNDQGFNLVKIGQFYAINAIGIVLFNLVLGHFEAKTGFILSQVFMLLYSAILWKTGGEFWLIIAFFLLGGFRSARSMATAMIRSLVNPANMGFAYGIAETMGSVALIAAPLLAGYLYGQNPLNMFRVGFYLTFLSIIISMVIGRVRQSKQNYS
jgi:DHA1 family multidrug resistance protein-like MFS transporter